MTVIDDPNLRLAFQSLDSLLCNLCHEKQATQQFKVKEKTEEQQQQHLNNNQSNKKSSSDHLTTLASSLAQMLYQPQQVSLGDHNLSNQISSCHNSSQTAPPSSAATTMVQSPLYRCPSNKIVPI